MTHSTRSGRGGGAPQAASLAAAAGLSRMPDPVLLLDTGPEGAQGRRLGSMVAWANAAAAAALDRDPADIVDRSLADTVPEACAQLLVQACGTVVSTGEGVVLTDVPPSADCEQLGGGPLDLRAWPVDDLIAVSWQRSLSVREHGASAATADGVLEHGGQSLDLLAHALPDVVLTGDPAGRLTYVSAAAQELLGHGPEELLGRRLQDLAHPDDAHTLDKALRRWLQEEAVPGPLRYRMQRHDGTSRWIGAHGRRLFNPGGETTGFVASLRDIEDEEQTRGELQEAKDRLELVLDSSQLGMWDWNMQTGETVFNEQWARIVGYTLSELEPTSIETWVRLANPDDLAASDGLIAAHAAGETEFYDLACRMRHKDGHWVWVRDRGQIVEWDDEGKPLRMTGTHEDISALQEAHEARATSEAALRLLLDTMIEGVVIQDAHGAIVSGNPAAERILGLTLEQMAGRTSTDPRWRAVREDGSDFPGEEHPAMVTLQTGQPVHGVLMGVHKVDGSLGWILINSRVIPALDDPAKVGGAITTFVDITAARESHEQLRDLASRDPLTNLLNRREMYERIDEARPGSGNDPRLGILFIDLDGLKDANDTYGHLAGDEVIIQSARRIQDSVRRDDVVARFGGDEFVVLLPSIHRATDAQRVATSIHEAVGQPIRVGEVEITITCSIGIGLLHHGEDPDSALARADAASYEAKRAGPGRTVVIDPAV